jgi:hypothetical protein
MAINPYSSQSISGYNSSPPPDDGSQTAANKVEWAKHKEKIGDPLKTLAEAINSQAVSAFNSVALEDWSTHTTTATIAESDWHGGILMTATGRVNYPDPATLENGWHNFVFNGSTGRVFLEATATTYFRRADGLTASGQMMLPGDLVKVWNTATQYLVQASRQQVYVGVSYSFSTTRVTGTDLFTATMGNTATCGTEHITCSYSPVDIGNLLEVESTIFVAPASNTTMRAALSQSTATTANGPISAAVRSFAATDYLDIMVMKTWVTSTATSYTFRVRSGANTGNHILNGSGLITATDVTPMMSYIKVTEYET